MLETTVKTKNQANQEYAEYLKQHIGNVQKGFQWLLDKHIVADESGVLKEQIRKHDESKEDPIEWNPYRDYFYMNGDETAFNFAWLHHIHYNPHHWQHWVLINDDNAIGTEGKMLAMQMPKQYIIEMICDWWAFSWSKGDLNEIFNWYDKNKDCMVLHEQTRKDVEELLGIIKKHL